MPGAADRARAAVAIGALGLGACGDGTFLRAPAAAPPGGSVPVSGVTLDAGTDAGRGTDDAGARTLDCPAGDVPAKTLACTGLYAEATSLRIAEGVRAYAPAVPLWSDGAQKQRWIALPAGTRVDATDPNEWRFPVGTKLWKEFSRGGRRVETRLWQKVREGFWVSATYLWNADQTAATAYGGGEVPLPDGSSYHVPTHDECDKCHRGRNEHILGFEAVNLGLPGATGFTLAQLVAEDRITPAPGSTTLAIGDDGTGQAAAALGWLHTNCGTTCHNGNQNATAYPAGMVLRLDARALDGGATVATPSRITTIGVPARTPSWAGRIRIVPGAPEASLLYQLISQRGTAQQMPPIATSVVDEIDDAAVARWIKAMSPARADAGPADGAAAPDAGAPADAGAPDAGTESDSG